MMTMADNKDKKVLNVPALRFPEFNGEWITRPIKDIADFIGGGTPSSANEAYWQGTIPWVSSSDIVEDNINDITISRYITEEAISNSATKLCSAPVILIVSRVGVGKVALSSKAICTSQDFCNLINIKVHPTFLAYSLSQIMKRKSIEVQGTSIKGITSLEIQKIILHIPSLQEQHKISDLFQLIDKRIAVQSKIIEKLETLIKGIRHKVFKQLRKDFGFNSTIGDILSFEQPQRYIVSSAEYSNDDTFIPVLTANKAFILGYTTETDGIYDKGDCIIIDDFTLDCKYVSFPFKVKSSAIKILTANNKFILRYTYEYLKSLELSTEEHKRHYITEIQPYSCVLPDENTLKTIALVFENLAYKLSNEQSLALILNKQRQYLLSKMFI